jgi:hypothetical protein
VLSSVTDFDQWDQALPHLCFGLNTHPSSVTNASPFELAHGFPGRVPLTLDLDAHAQLTGDRGAADYALAVHNRHQAAADNVAAAQVRLGRLLDQRATPADVKPGNQMYLDASPQHSPPHQVPYKLANRWMGPYAALDVRGPSVPNSATRNSLTLRRPCVPSVVVTEHSVSRFTVFGGTDHTASCPRRSI